MKIDELFKESIEQKERTLNPSTDILDRSWEKVQEGLSGRKHKMNWFSSRVNLGHLLKDSIAVAAFVFILIFIPATATKWKREASAQWTGKNADTTTVTDSNQQQSTDKSPKEEKQMDIPKDVYLPAKQELSTDGFVGGVYMCKDFGIVTDNGKGGGLKLKKVSADKTETIIIEGAKANYKFIGYFGELFYFADYGNDGSMYCYDLANKKYSKLELPLEKGAGVLTSTIDRKGDIWISYNFPIVNQTEGYVMRIDGKDSKLISNVKLERALTVDTLQFDLDNNLIATNYDIPNNITKFIKVTYNSSNNKLTAISAETSSVFKLLRVPFASKDGSYWGIDYWNNNDIVNFKLNHDGSGIELIKSYKNADRSVITTDNNDDIWLYHSILGGGDPESKSYLRKFENGDFAIKYETTPNGGQISIYDDYNIMIGSRSGGIYSVINGGTYEVAQKIANKVEEAVTSGDAAKIDAVRLMVNTLKESPYKEWLLEKLKVKP